MSSTAPPKVKSYRVPGSDEPGYSYTIRHPDNQHSLELPQDRPYYGDNVFGILKESVRNHASEDFLGRRAYDPASNTHGAFEWLTYTEAYQRVLRLGSGLVQVFQRHTKPALALSQITRLPLGMYSQNRLEWILTDYAGVSQNLYTVALYDTLGADSLEYIVNHAEIEVLVCSLDKVPRLLKMHKALPSLKAVVSMDSFDSPDQALPSPFNTTSTTVLRQWAESLGVALYDLAEVEQMGATQPVSPKEPKPDDLFCLCYTSGTTGTPKAAKILHRNMDCAQRLIPRAVTFRGKRRGLSYLPLAHIYERFCQVYLMSVGGQIGVFSGNILNIVDDIQTLKPSVFNSVPRLLNRIYDRLVAGTIRAPGLTGVVARRAVRDKMAQLEQGKGNVHGFWDRILFNKIRAMLGGNIQFVLTGSAPIDKDVLQFLRVCFCCQVTEGWGATESSGFGIANHPTENQSGRVGVPMHGMEVRLKDVPEMNYFGSDRPCPRGELLLRGPCVFGGYYKDAEKTREALLEGGWLATGDVGRLNEDGTVSIIDRKKNIFKLSQGEYVAPEALENVYGNDGLVQQVFVHGDSLQSCLVGVVVPDPETFVPWAQKLVGPMELEELCKDQKVVEAVLERLAERGREVKLQGYEVMKRIKLDHRPFDIEVNGMLTPTLKLKRNVAADYYRADIDQMYASI